MPNREREAEVNQPGAGKYDSKPQPSTLLLLIILIDDEPMLLRNRSHALIRLFLRFRAYRRRDLAGLQEDP